MVALGHAGCLYKTYPCMGPGWGDCASMTIRAPRESWECLYTGTEKSWEHGIYYLDINYPAQVIPITNQSWKIKGSSRGKGRPEKQRKGRTGEDSILVKRQTLLLRCFLTFQIYSKDIILHVSYRS